MRFRVLKGGKQAEDKAHTFCCSGSGVGGGRLLGHCKTGCGAPRANSRSAASWPGWSGGHCTWFFLTGRCVWMISMLCWIFSSSSAGGHCTLSLGPPWKSLCSFSGSGGGQTRSRMALPPRPRQGALPTSPFSSSA